jgi:pyruvate/2-oxoglutarate dehydrogenase complex dihydrolipoamide acyltransferase (E2) component
MKATISADHCVTVGAEATRFIEVLVVYLEEPLRMMI